MHKMGQGNVTVDRGLRTIIQRHNHSTHPWEGNQVQRKLAEIAVRCTLTQLHIRKRVSPIELPRESERGAHTANGLGYQLQMSS